MAIVWPCPLVVDAYAAAGRDLGFPRPDCSSCAGPLVFWPEPGDRLPEDAVVVIQDPHLDGDTLTYSIKLLDGTVPTATGPCALFIDPFGRPLSPVSAAGMHRRERRRR